MSSDGYYYQSSAPYTTNTSSYNNLNQSAPYTTNTSSYNNHNHSSSSTPPFPLHLCFFLVTLFLFVVMSYYLSYDSLLEGVVDNLRILLILSPLLLLLALHFLSGGGGDRGRGGVPFFLSLPERDSFHRAGGSPWGVALVLVLLLFMVSYQSSFQGRWFPLLGRSRAR